MVVVVVVGVEVFCFIVILEMGEMLSMKGG